MSDRLDASTVIRLAALALGMAFAERDRDTAVHELIDESDGRIGLLVRAKRRVAGSVILDHDSHRQATELLDLAIARGNSGEADRRPRTLRPAS